MKTSFFNSLMSKITSITSSNNWLVQPKTAGSQTITITASGAWTCSYNGNCTISPTTGNAGSTVVTFTWTSNGKECRYTTATFSLNEDTNINVVVNACQNGTSLCEAI